MFNGAAMAAALAAGSIDILTGTVVPTAEAVARGIDLRVIAPGLIYDRGQGQSVVIVVANASPAKTAADLNGKTIAVNGLGDLTHLALLAWLGQNGADVKSVKLLESVPRCGRGPRSGPHRRRIAGRTLHDRIAREDSYHRRCGCPALVRVLSARSG